MPRKFSLHARLGSFKYALKGLRTLLRDEHNARVHLVAGLLAISLGLLLKLEPMEWVAITLAIALVFIAEILNTALETLCNHISPSQHELIGRTKDLAASSVLVAAGAALAIGAFVFIPKLDL